MAVGDTASDNQSIAAGAYLDLQPSSTIEWIIHNIYAEAEISLHWYDGANDIQFTPATSASIVGWLNGLTIHCKNGLRLRIKNENAAAKRIGYDGIVSHT